MTNDYQLIVPLMAGVIVSQIVAERLFHDSIYTLKLTKQGIRLSSGRDVDVMESVRVEEVMVKQPVTVPVDLPVSLLASEFLKTGRHGFPVVNSDGSLYGVVSLEDYRRTLSEKPNSRRATLVHEIATQDMITVFPDDTVGTALRRMAPRDISRLPVVAHDNPHHLVGVVRRNDIVRAYEVGALRREQAVQLAEVMRNINDAHAIFVDITLNNNSWAVGKTVAEIELPRPAIFVSIQRNRQLLIPHGDTRLQAGDVVTALCERDCLNEVKEDLLKEAVS
jgi:CIC family chloride channel protein